MANQANSVDPQEVLRNLQKYCTQPKKAVMENPLRSVVYSLAIKTLSTIAFYFSQVASGFILAFSILMIDRIIVLNFKDFKTNFLNNLLENPTFKAVFIGEKKELEVEAE